jgi:hypothetical protein
LHRKIFRKKTFLFYLGRARRLDPVRFGPAAGPREPISARQPRLAWLSRRCSSACVPHTPGAPPPRLFKAEPEPKLSRALLASHRLHLCCAAGARNRRRLAASSRRRAVTGVSPSRKRTGQVARRHWSSSFSPHQSTVGRSRHLPELRDIEPRTELRSSLPDVHRTAT